MLELLSDSSDFNSHKNVSCYYPPSKNLDHQSPRCFQTSKCASPSSDEEIPGMRIHYFEWSCISSLLAILVS